MAIRECDRVLSEALNQTTGLPEVGFTEDEVEAIYRNQVYPTFYETEAGKAFRADYVCDDKFLLRLEQERIRRFGEEGQIGSAPWPYALFSYRLEEIVNDLLRVRDGSLTLANPPEPEAPEEERPRDARGQFISNIQAEVESDIASGTVSTVEIKQKRAQSQEYNSAFVKATAMQEPRHKSGSIPAEVIEFANDYNAAPASQLRFVNGVITIAGKRYNRESYDNLMNKASEASLVRG
jgi:hypothetical protein